MSIIRQKRVANKPNYDGSMQLLCGVCGIPTWDEAEYKFYPNRKWAFDYAWTKLKIAIEIDGAVHRTKERFDSDREKFNFATINGWVVLHLTPFELKNYRSAPVKRNKRGQIVKHQTMRETPEEMVRILFASKE